MTTIVYDYEFELNGIEYLLDIEIEGKITDESFSHEFGIQEDWGFEFTGLELLTVTGEKGVVIDPVIIKQIENRLDIEDFKELDLDFED